MLTLETTTFIEDHPSLLELGAELKLETCRGLGTTASRELVTVITPTHNSGEWLDETAQSVLGQTHEDLEYIIVDDGSSDNSLEIANHYAKIDSRVRVKSVNFGSVSKTRQVGIDLARKKGSNFVGFLDGDDRWHPDFLEKGLAHFQRFGSRVLVVYSQLNLIDEHGNSIEEPGDPARGTLSRTLTGLIGFDEYLLGDTPARTASAVIARTSALPEVAFRQEAEPSEDYDLWMRVLRDNPAGVFYGIPEQLMDYRIRGNQLTANTRKIFEKLDKLYVEFVPQMRQPSKRWEVYEIAAAGALNRGLPEFAIHFKMIADALADNPDFLPTTIG